MDETSDEFAELVSKVESALTYIYKGAMLSHTMEWPGVAAYADGLEALATIGEEYIKVFDRAYPEWEGQSNQGHSFASHRFSFEDVIVIFKAMGGDENNARMAQEVEKLQIQLDHYRVLAATRFARMQGLHDRLERKEKLNSLMLDDLKACAEVQEIDGTLFGFNLKSNIQSYENNYARD